MMLILIGNIKKEYYELEEINRKKIFQKKMRCIDAGSKLNPQLSI